MDNIFDKYSFVFVYIRLHAISAVFIVKSRFLIGILQVVLFLFQCFCGSSPMIPIFSASNIRLILKFVLYNVINF